MVLKGIQCAERELLWEHSAVFTVDLTVPHLNHDKALCQSRVAFGKVSELFP